MTEKEIKALISLLDDEDAEVFNHVEDKILSLGNQIIPFLELEWEKNFSPVVQERIEELIHVVQFNNLKERLQSWVHSESDDLLKGMWVVATYLYPDLSYEKVKADIEQYYYEVWLELGQSENPIDQIKLLNSVIFGKLKFSANTKNFHSPSNSMIKIVLESKKGNPITLCVVYLLIAQKLKLPVYGVNLPNLFVLTYKQGGTQFYINAFNKGLIFSRKDVDSFIEQLKLEPKEIFYEPCDNLSVIQRVLRNLVVSFEKLGESQKVTEVRELLNSIS